MSEYAHMHHMHTLTHIGCLQQDIEFNTRYHGTRSYPYPPPHPHVYRCGMCSICPLRDGGLGGRSIPPLIMIHLPIRPMHNLPSWSGLRRRLSMRLCVRYVSFRSGCGAQSDPCAKGIETVGSRRCSRRLICVCSLFTAPPDGAQEAKDVLWLCRRRWA